VGRTIAVSLGALVERRRVLGFEQRMTGAGKARGTL